MSLILIADDNASMRDGIRISLEGLGHTIEEAANGKEALDKLEQIAFDLIITDLRMPEADGLEILHQARKWYPNIMVILITAYGTIEKAVKAMRLGAYDFVTKPFSADEMEMKVEKALEQVNLTKQIQQLSNENIYLKEQIIADFGDIVGDSIAMQKVYDLIESVAITNTAVLILGESGTGKELVARAIHRNSNRKDKTFIKVSCASLAEGVLESELFGHEKGSFTGAGARRLGRFELADKGTLFLDEIGDISLNTQVKLLRVLQEKQFERVGSSKTIQVDVRIIAATNKNLLEAIKQGVFREDLYYRLNVIPITLPPLRERKEDIHSLIQRFMNKYNREAGKRIIKIDPIAEKLLLEYDYPGNVRELENAIERAIVLARGDTIKPKHLPMGLQEQKIEEFYFEDGKNLTQWVEEYEKKLIIAAYKKANSVQSETARLLGIERTTLRYKLKKYAIDN